MFDRFKQRSRELERLDTGDYTPDEYAKWQRELRIINRIFGEVRALRNSLYREITLNNVDQVSILDVGAGSGELLRHLKRWTGENTFLAGAEINPEAARTMLAAGIQAVHSNALKLPFADDSFDFVICSLFLHHLDDNAAVEMLREMSRVSKRRIFVIDLRRHPIAYYFFRITGYFLLQKFTRDDGSLSVLRSFTPEELLTLGERAGLTDVSVRRSAAYRIVLSGK